MKHSISYTSIAYFLCRANFIGISFLDIILLSKQDSWISIILATIIGILPVYFIYKISNYEENLTLNKKIEKLFPTIHIIVKLILTITFLSLALLSFENLINLVNIQFLSKTPNYIISISFIIPIIYLSIQKDTIIARTSLILYYISIFIVILSIIGLIPKIEINNLKPILEHNPIKSIIPILSYNILPLFMLLSFPNKDIKQSIWKGYFISLLSLLVISILIISIIGINFTSLFLYPEFHILKLAYNGIINYRLENILTTSWLIDIFMFVTISIKTCNNLLNIKKKYVIPIMLIISSFIFKFIFINNYNLLRIIPDIVFISLSSIIVLMYIKSIKQSK